MVKTKREQMNDFITEYITVNKRDHYYRHDFDEFGNKTMINLILVDLCEKGVLHCIGMVKTTGGMAKQYSTKKPVKKVIPSYVNVGGGWANIWPEFYNIPRFKIRARLVHNLRGD